ncbi:MAG: hypothetical protein ACYDIC_11975 [Desulfobaccales bacterium]
MHTEDKSLRSCQVATYSGSRLHERPLRFTWGEEWLEVGQVLEQGYEPDHLFFKVAAADGRVFLLQYWQATDSWEARLGEPAS